MQRVAAGMVMLSLAGVFVLSLNMSHNLRGGVVVASEGGLGVKGGGSACIASLVSSDQVDINNLSR